MKYFTNISSESRIFNPTYS